MTRHNTIGPSPLVRSVGVVIALVLASLIATPIASAEHGGLHGGTGTFQNTNDTAESEGSQVRLVSTAGSERDHTEHNPIRFDPPCAEYEQVPIYRTVTTTVDDPTPSAYENVVMVNGGDPEVLFGPSGETTTTTTTTQVLIGYRDGDCTVFWDCRGERIDEILTGELSNESPKKYAEYVQTIGSIIQAFVPFSDWNIGDPETFASLAEALAEGGLGDRPSPLRMPIFYYCLRGEDGPMNLWISGLEDVPYLPSFGWDTDVNTEFDIPGSTQTLVDRAWAILAAHDPQMAAIPPLEQGYTIVKFPMWLWLDDPVIDQVVTAYSDPATVRVSVAAVFDHIEWNMDGEIVSCTLADMRRYTGGDPMANIPKCSHRFLELVDYELTAQVFYNVYERISYRGSESYPWPNNRYTVHPTTPVLVVDLDGGPMSVHELVSVVVAEEVDNG